MGEPSRASDSSPATAEAEPAAQAVDLVKVYGSGSTEVRALDGVSVTFPRAHFTAIMGPSGSGKSTLMHCMAGLDTATSGVARLGADDLTRMGDDALTRLRRDRVGFVFQAFNLVPTLSAAENITLPLDIAGKDVDGGWMRTIVDAVGLADRLDHRPSQLSGGQQQRVACARALITRPDIVFADEPTGNLDSRSGAEVLGLLRRSVDEYHQSVVMVTHDANAASYADRVVFLSDGRVIDEVAEPSAEVIAERMVHLEPEHGA
jgi:putative ABC transport system ATP-binding protein